MQITFLSLLLNSGNEQAIIISENFQMFFFNTSIFWYNCVFFFKTEKTYNFAEKFRFLQDSIVVFEVHNLSYKYKRKN